MDVCLIPVHVRYARCFHGDGICQDKKGNKEKV